MTSARDGSSAGAVSARARDLHRKLLERVLLRSENQSVKDVFRRYDRERVGVLTVEQFRGLLRDHDFLDVDTELLLRHLGEKDQQSVSFHAFMGDVQLGGEQSYKNGNAMNSPKKVQQLAQLSEMQPKKKAQPQNKNKGGVKNAKVEMTQDPMEAIRTKLRERVMGHSKSIREVFMEYDDDGNGQLDYEEFGRFMAKYKFTPDETQTIVDYLDRDRSGTIDYDEFAAGLLFYRPPVPAPVASVKTVAAPSPTKSFDRAAPQKAQQASPTQSTRNAQTSKQTDLQQIMSSIRSKFGEALKKSKQRTGRPRDLRADFDNYDVDGSNSLDHQEFGALLVGLGIKLKAQELRTVLQEIDPDEEETIGFQTIANLLGVKEATERRKPKTSTEVKQYQKSSASEQEALNEFHKYDQDGSGELDYAEFRRLMHESGVKDDQEIDALIDEIDADGNGSISFDEFARVHAHRIKLSSEVNDEVAVAFSKHDQDGSGELDYTEFRRLMHDFGVKDNEMIDALIDEIDEDASGSISFKEFSRVYDRRIKPSLKVDDEGLVTFNKFDRDGSGELDYDEFRRMMHELGIKDSEDIDALIDEIDKDRSGAISLSEFARVYDRRIKPALKSNRQRQEQTSSRRNAGNTDYNSRPPKTVKKTSQAENDQNARSRLVALQEQELQFMERVFRRHNSIENAFLEFDREGRNEMDFEQFRDFMGHYGITDEASISMLLKRLDADNSGMIDLQEFLSVFNAQRLTRHKGAIKTNARGDQQQNESTTAGQRVPRREVKPIASSDSSGARTETKPNNAARLRELEEKWIRGAIAGCESIQAAFTAVDRDQDGEITRDEFRKLMSQFGIRDEDDISSLMKKLDADGNECIEYEEFATTFHEARVNRDQERRQSFTAAIPRRTSVTKPVAPVESKNARGARLRDLQIKWMKRVLSCHDSIESAFYQYDNDGNGELDHEEFRHFMKRYGIVKNDDIDALIRRLDTDSSGAVSFEEFSVVFNPLRVNPGSTAKGISAMAAAAPEDIFDPEELESILEIERELAQRMAHQTRDLRLAFRKFDANGNGLLEYKEFRSVLKSYRLPEMEIRKVIRHLDRDVSGFIDYKEFIAGFGAFKEGGAAATASTQKKKVGKRASPGKGNTKPKTHFRRSLAKPQGHPKTLLLDALKKTMLERILRIHGTVQRAFRDYDLDKEGCLNEAQFVKLVLDCNFSRDEAARLLDVFDQNQSGTVEYQEFLAQLVVKGSSMESY